MKKLQITTYLSLSVFMGLCSGTLQAQSVDLKAATYGSDAATPGTAPVSGVTNSVGPFTVTQIYTNSTSSYTYNFVTDASGVSNYIYQPISASAPDPFTVGGTYTGVSLTSSPFGTPANLELTVPAGTTVPAPTATGAPSVYNTTNEGSLTTTTVLTNAYTVATPTTPNDIEAVEFTFTASATTNVNAVTGNYTGTDMLNGDKINFYRPTNGLSFVAGQTYTIDGFAFAFSTGTEIYDPSIVTTAVPEPATYVAGGLFMVIAGLSFRQVRRRMVA